jgi:hypothetical protein
VFIQAATPGELIPRLDELAERISGQLLGEAGARDTAVSSGPPGQEAARTHATDREFNALLERIEALENAVYSGSSAGDAGAAD